MTDHRSRADRGRTVPARDTAVSDLDRSRAGRSGGTAPQRPDQSPSAPLTATGSTLPREPPREPGLDLSHGNGGGGRGPGRRGRRGEAQWRRHGDIGRQHVIIGQLNVQSLMPKLPEIRADIDDRYSFDILMLCETWTSVAIPDRLLNISGYKIVCKYRPRDGPLARGHGAVALYVRESLETETIARPVTGVAGSSLETVWAAVRVGKRRRVSGGRRGGAIRAMAPPKGKSGGPSYHLPPQTTDGPPWAYGALALIRLSRS